MKRGINVKKSPMRAALLFMIISCFLMSNIVFAQQALEQNKDEIDMSYLKSVMEMIKEKYKDQITEEELIEGALKGMFDTMDPYTVYFTNEEAESFFGDMEGTYKGIGVMFTEVGKNLMVVKVFEASPAEDAGIIEGDIIVEVDGKNVTGASSEEIASLIKGEEGTKVTLGIMRDGEAGILKFEVVRKEIRINPVTYYIKDDIGYIKLEMFNSNTSEFMNKALEEMDKNQIKKIVLDLRDNPGGEVSQAVAVAEKLVPQGLITRLDFKSESQKDEEYYSDLKNLKYKLVVLVNEMSASASEILAGAIQDTSAGVLVGTRTFGKGKVQNIYPVLSPEAYKKYEDQLGVKVVNGYELFVKHGIRPLDEEIIGWTKITTGEYYTPKGRMIDGVGLEPDIHVENEKTVSIDVRSVKKLKKVSKPGLNTKSADVYNAEQILKLCGYEVDEPDTLMDKKTFNAVAKFQKDSGLYSYGVLDFTTQQALNEKLEGLVLKLDRQYTKALEVLNSKNS